jgi:hypothetical protein
MKGKFFEVLFRVWAHPLIKQLGWYGIAVAVAIAYVEIRVSVADNPAFVKRLSRAGNAIYEIIKPSDELPPELPAPTPQSPPQPPSVPAETSKPDRGQPSLSESLGLDK